MALKNTAASLTGRRRPAYDGAREGAVLVKKKGKILLACLVVLAGIAAWCLVPRPAVGEDYRADYVAAGEELRNVTGQVDLDALSELLQRAERRGYRREIFPRQLREDTVEITVAGSGGPWHVYLDGGACVVYRSADRGCYPIVNGEELLEQVWALLPEP